MPKGKAQFEETKQSIPNRYDKDAEIIRPGNKNDYD